MAEITCVRRVETADSTNRLQLRFHACRSVSLRRVRQLIALSFVVGIIAPLCIAQGARTKSSQSRRPLTSDDYDTWRSIQSERLSRDGKWVAYVLMPESGDAEAVVTSVSSQTEYRIPIGVWPSLNSAPPLHWTFDSDFLVVQSRSGSDQSATEARNAGAAENGLVVVDSRTGAKTRIPGAESFQVPQTDSDWIVYKTSGAGAGPLIVKNLANNAEREFEDVTEFSLANDGKTLVYVVSSADKDKNGVYAVQLAGSMAPKLLMSAAGRYGSLTWDPRQAQLAFIHESKVYLWARDSGMVSALTGCAVPNLQIAEASPVTFSNAGDRVFFECVPSSESPSSGKNVEHAHFELWNWKDAQPISVQKINASHGRTNALLTMWIIDQRRLVQIATLQTPTVVISENGRWALGIADRQYLKAVDYDGPISHADVYLINTTTGVRRMLLKDFRGPYASGATHGIRFSPDGRYVVYFDEKDWRAIRTEDGQAINITRQLRVSFADDDRQIPDTPSPYGAPRWTTDGNLLLYDKFDIWKISSASWNPQNITRGLGRKSQISFRYVDPGTDSPSAPIDENKPLLLRAEHQTTHATGFYEAWLRGEREPRQLLFGAQKFTPPVKAEAADVYLLKASTFRTFPDLLVADSNFRNLRRLTNANPQQDEFRWGTAEMVSFQDPAGHTLQGILYKPDGFDPKKKYPMLVYIYEHLSDRVYDYFPPRPEWGHAISISYYVSNGYLVLTPDIHYSIGLPGRSALQCVLSAIDVVAQKGFVNEKAIGIQGHSWGGSEVEYIVAHTDRFHAAEAGAGVADIIRRYDDIRPGSGWAQQWGYEKNQGRIGCSLWQCPTLFIENSPILNANHVNTPLLMLRNDADPTGPLAESLEFYFALRRLDKEVYLLNYAGEGHDLSKWANQKDFAIRMQEFFDYHLKGGPLPEWMKSGIAYSESH